MELKTRPAYVIFDLETTGLSPELDQILEIGAVAVDADLRVIDTFRRVIGLTDAGEARIEANAFVKNMHTVNHLLEECGASFDSEHLAGLAFGSWLSGLGFVPKSAGATPEELAQVAGNSVDFDRTFARVRLPRAADFFSHRYLEVSGMARFLESPACGKLLVRTGNELPHRALEDALDELRELRHIAGTLRCAHNVPRSP